MALPADFAKIFGSTFTGGLTPIPDVDYAKGWEYVGSNPPTKNDFSYLQNFSDLKAQWLYNYITTTSNAASRTVGIGTNQIPDMSAWTVGIAPDAIWIKFPDGTIIQMGASGTSNTDITFPIPFPSQCMIFIAMPRSSASTAFIGTVQEDSSRRSRTGTRVLGFSGVTSVTTAAFGYLTIGR